MRELIMFVGLPRSGKSSASMMASKDLGAPVCNPDSIRMAHHGQAFIAEAEPFIWAMAHVMVRSWFIQGYKTVILDATNITKARRDEWKRDCDQRTFYVIKTSVETCLIRAAGNEKLKMVIKRMAAQYEPVDPTEGIVKSW